MTSRRFLVIVLAGLLVVGAVAVAVAQRTDPASMASSGAPPRSGPLPVEAASAPAVDVDRWLNTTDNQAVDVDGKVVLYEFWTFGCVNCRAVIPHVKAWYDRYGPDGLVVLSIHTPEFDREADPAAVAEFVAGESIRYPVALDPDRSVWRSFENHYWPAFYLHDVQGRRRLTHFGEGAYDETEDAIRQLLGVDPASPRATSA